MRPFPIGLSGSQEPSRASFVEPIPEATALADPGPALRLASAAAALGIATDPAPLQRRTSLAPLRAGAQSSPVPSRRQSFESNRASDTSQDELLAVERAAEAGQGPQPLFAALSFTRPRGMRSMGPTDSIADPRLMRQLLAAAVAMQASNPPQTPLARIEEPQPIQDQPASSQAQVEQVVHAAQDVIALLTPIAEATTEASTEYFTSASSAQSVRAFQFDSSCTERHSVPGWLPCMACSTIALQWHLSCHYHATHLHAGPASCCESAKLQYACAHHAALSMPQQDNAESPVAVCISCLLLAGRISAG